MTIGQQGLFRVWGEIGLGTKATIQGHQDTGFLSVQLENGRFVTWHPETAEVHDTAPVAGAWERTTFDGANILLARPNGPDGPVRAYEWFNT